MKNISLLFLVSTLFIGLTTTSTKVLAQELALSDSANISLLTATPGEEVYAHYGHTAIRVCDPVQKFDLVFNYGLFDFNSPNFLYRFVKGETDYICGAGDYRDFLIEYQLSNRGIQEQVLNLHKAEKERIWQALVKNIQPENRTYRYNFFYNNCATKPRDLITENLNGRLEYRMHGRYKTLRGEIHHFTANHPWTQLGIDFLIGADADKTAGLKSQQFAPTLLAESFNHAYIVGDSSEMRPLVLETRQTVSIDPESIDSPSHLPNPMLVFWLLFGAIAALSLYEFVRFKQFQAITAILYGLYGLVGSLIAFMVLFSVHPATDNNYLLLWLNPFHLIFAIGMIFGTFRRKVVLPYLAINLILQFLALAGLFLLPQQLHPAMLPMLLILLCRTILGTHQQARKRKKIQ
jgi:hypothetical protein